MIYLSDDYIEKYIDTLSYLINRAVEEGYSFDYIEKHIAYSKMNTIIPTFLQLSKNSLVFRG